MRAFLTGCALGALVPPVAAARRWFASVIHEADVIYDIKRAPDAQAVVAVLEREGIEVTHGPAYYDVRAFLRG